MRQLENFTPAEETQLYEMFHRKYHYDGASGNLYRRNKLGEPTDEVAGYFNGVNRIVCIGKRNWVAARVIVCMLTKRWPTNFAVKFVNGDHNDTSRRNLKLKPVKCRLKVSL